MLRRGELLLWGRGEEEEEAEAGCYHPKDLGGGGGSSRRRRSVGGWPPRRRRGRPPGSFRPPPPFPPRLGPPSCCCCFRPRRPRVLLSLRPANFGGRRGCSEGMRAPCNTNQFLMGEKYRLMHLRSDSVGTEEEEEEEEELEGSSPGGGSSSDCGDGGVGVDPCCLDMEAYLGALENARGGLLDGGAGTGPSSSASSSAPHPLLGLPLEENSLPYFPSEDDLLQSQSFMERDFQQFCSTIVA